MKTFEQMKAERKQQQKELEFTGYKLVVHGSDGWIEYFAGLEEAKSAAFFYESEGISCSLHNPVYGNLLL